MAPRKKKRPTLAQRGERADAAVAAGKRSLGPALAVGAVARTPIKIRAGGKTRVVQGSNRAAAAAAAGTVAWRANKARRQAAAKQGYRPKGYRGQVGRSRSTGRGGHSSHRQRRDKYGRFA